MVMNDSWREAKSLQALEAEIQEFYPGTTTWEIGDADHQDSRSDHNPNDANVVCAKDILANGGLSLAALADHLVTNPHPNLRYVIYNRSIAERKNAFAWHEYSGKNAHDKHLHVSVGNGPDGRSTGGYDSTAPWGIAELAGHPSVPSTPNKPTKPSTGTTKLGDKMGTLKRGDKGRKVRILQGLLTAWGYKTSIDGIFGAQTEKQVKAFQKEHAKPSDGLVGKLTWNALLGL